MTAEIRKLQGTWAVQTLEIDGQPTATSMLSGAKIIVMGDRFTTIAMGATYEGSLKVDPSKSPAAIDMLFEAGPEKGNTSLGIYDLNGDAWKLCLTVTGNTRPTRFKTAPGSGHAYETLKRERAATKKGSAAREARKPPQPPVEKSEPIPELEGEWTMVSCFMDGSPIDKSMLAVGRRVTRGNETTVSFGPQVFMKARITVDRSVHPIAFDLACSLGPAAGKKQLGIFERKGDKLRISFSPPGGPRPGDFGNAPGRTVTEWKLAAK